MTNEQAHGWTPRKPGSAVGCLQSQGKVRRFTYPWRSWGKVGEFRKKVREVRTFLRTAIGEKESKYELMNFKNF